MKIHYIYHSGFLVELAECYLLFDYYKGDLPKMNVKKPILVFASHNHRDHYNPEIFDLLRNMGMGQIYAYLAKDIPVKKYPKSTEAVKVYGNKVYELPFGISLQTLLSTDAGVAFLVKTPEENIYHAGDLNDWVWAEETEQYNRQMTGSYRHEIDKLKDILIDVAFVPLDPRQGKDYAKGMLYFLKQTNTKKIYPMHYWEQPETIKRFMQEHSEYAGIVQYTE